MTTVKGLEIKNIEGKTISKVRFSLTWQNNPEEFDNITIEFTDGTKIELNAMTQAGCEHCDDDGSACTYLNVWTSEVKQ